MQHESLKIENKEPKNKEKDLRKDLKKDLTSCLQHLQQQAYVLFTRAREKRQRISRSMNSKSNADCLEPHNTFMSRRRMHFLDNRIDKFENEDSISLSTDSVLSEGSANLSNTRVRSYNNGLQESKGPELIPTMLSRQSGERRVDSNVEYDCIDCSREYLPGYDTTEIAAISLPIQLNTDVPEIIIDYITEGESERKFYDRSKEVTNESGGEYRNEERSYENDPITQSNQNVPETIINNITEKEYQEFSERFLFEEHFDDSRRSTKIDVDSVVEDAKPVVVVDTNIQHASQTIANYDDTNSLKEYKYGKEETMHHRTDN